jgi:molecular chaperone GrpE (heat shock protein)
MTDDSPDRRDGSRATTSFEEWLDQHADSQGISRQELFERLVSSYWTLNEMVQLLDESENSTSLSDARLDNGDEGGVGAPWGTDGRDDADGGRSHGNREDADRPEPTRRRDRLGDLRERLDDLEDRLDDERERGRSQDKALEAAADRLSGIEADIAELAAESEAARESLSAEYESLSDRIDDLEDDVDGRHKQLANEQKRLRSRLNAEFEDLETILEYLIDRTDDLDAGLSAVEQRHDDELSRLRWERETLRSVLRDAAELGARAGECAACGERVEIGFLVEPYCPACESLLTGVEAREKWLFLSDVILTADADHTRGSGPADGAAPTRERGEAGILDGEDDDEQATEADRSGGADTDPTRPADSGVDAGPAGTAHGDRSADAAESEPVDPGRPDDEASGNDDSADSQFSFGDIESETVPDPEADDGSGSDADGPFGDLGDLEREEKRHREE